MQHSTDLAYGGGYAKLAEDLGNLRYDALAEFLGLLSAKIARDGAVDEGRNRLKLAAELYAAAAHIDNAWKICEPFMGK